MSQAGDELRKMARWLPRMATAGLVLCVAVVVEFIWLGQPGSLFIFVPALCSIIGANVITRVCRPYIEANAARLDRTEQS